MLNGLKRESQDFAHNIQKIMILRELQKIWGDIFRRGEISTDMFFILANITTNFKMYASEFEGMLFTMLSEEPFANHRLDTTNGNK